MTARNARFALAGALFLYVVWMRTYDVASTFLMLGEQTRDWTVALGSLTDLPLTGAPSTAGGRGFGPAYYWLLWLGRLIIGPFFDNLPHAGGIIVALLQSIGDTWLFVVLARRIHWGLALAICLLLASGPFDIAISSVIWNPPVAAALVKMAIASALMLTTASPLWRIAMTAMLAWMAVQAHLTAVFVAAPLLLAVTLQRLLGNDEPSTFAPGATADQKGSSLQRVGMAAGTIAAVILVLQIPFFLAIVREPSAPAGPTAAIAGITNPQAVKALSAYDSVTGITGNIVLPMPDSFKFTLPTLLAGVIVAIAFRRDLVILGATIGGVLTATLLFTITSQNYDRYWFLTLAPSLTLTFGMAVAAIPSKAVVKWAGIVLAGLVMTRQPDRITVSTRFFEYPQYGTMVRASQELVLRAPVVRDIVTRFDVHPTMDRHFVYEILGGRIDPTALYTAVINADGSLSVVP
jgi:hypothetical protein